MKKKSVFLLLTVASVGLSHAASTALTVHDGLLNYWNLDGNGDDTAGSYTNNASTVADNVNVAGIAGAAVINSAGGLFGGAADFERTVGTDGRLRAAETADTIADGESLTISLWTQFDNDKSGNWQAILSKGEGANYRIATHRNASADNAAYAGGAGDIDSGAIVRDGGGAWHHIVVTTNNGVGTEIWVDGVSGGTNTPGNISSPTAGNDFVIGNNVENLNRMWDGQIDDVAMWGRVLTADEIACIFDSGVAGTSLGQIIPEPTSGLLVGLSGLLFAARRRR